MRILKISDVYFPRINGVSTSIKLFRRELEARGHEVRLIAPGYGDGAGPDRDDSGIVRVKGRPVPFDPEDRLVSLRAFRRGSATLAAGDVDLVHIHTPFQAHRAGVRLAHRLEVPVIETYHTFFEEYFHHYVGFLPPAFLRWLARRVSRSQCNALDRVIVPSEPMRRVLDDYGVTTPTEVIPTGLDMGELEGGDGERFRRAHGIEPDRPTLVHAGRLAFEKNIDFLLEVTARVRRRFPRLLLIIAGDGPATPHLKGQAERLGLGDAVLFTGYLDRAGELRDCYRAGDLFVFASRTETQGLVLLEAMALGVPLVSTAVMGTRPLVTPGRGAVEAREDLEDFAAKVEALLADPERRRRLGREAREFAHEWSSDAMTGRLLAAYERTLA